MTSGEYHGRIKVMSPSKYNPEETRLLVETPNGDAWFGCSIKPLPGGIQEGAEIGFMTNPSGKYINNIWATGHPKMEAGGPIAPSGDRAGMPTPMRPPAPAEQIPQGRTLSKDEYVMACGLMNHYLDTHPDVKPPDFLDLAAWAARAARTATFCFRADRKTLEAYFEEVVLLRRPPAPAPAPAVTEEMRGVSVAPDGDGDGDVPF